MARTAIHAVLSKKLLDGELKVVESLELEAPKTKMLFSAVKNFLPALLIAAKENKNIIRASSNLARGKSINGELLNVEDLLRYKNVLLDKKAVMEIK